MVFIYSLILLLFFNICTFVIVDRIIEPMLMKVAKIEVKSIATDAINGAIEKNREKIDINKLIVRHSQGDGKNSPISFNPSVYQDFLTGLTKDIHEEIGKKTNHFSEANDDEKELKVYYIPLGAATGNTIFANTGPKIPIEMMLAGTVESQLKTNTKSEGINNVWLEILVELNVDIQVIIPSLTSEEPMKTTVKIGDYFFPGEVPEYYSGNGSGNSPVISYPSNDESNQ
ncbi:sporulation protein YunB [Bacillus gobiensis]|uniref:sporulation protein YunB n=1 Tax=Bacillus gobiensis TaxID=1441095 RepID=UPI003D1E73A0